MSNEVPPCDQENVRYCEKHEMHWVPGAGMSQKGSSCPWCQRDVFWDELEYIRDTFVSAVQNFRRPKGGQQVSFHGDFSNITPSSVTQMDRWIRRWDEVLGKNVRRGT